MATRACTVDCAATGNASGWVSSQHLRSGCPFLTQSGRGQLEIAAVQPDPESHFL
jgi:hypothetical protein